MQRIILTLTLSLLLGFVSGETFQTDSLSITREEDLQDLELFDNSLECHGSLNPQFSLETNGGPFSIRSKFFFVSLHSTRILDAELGDEVYVVYIICDDGNPNPPPDIATVTITITSVNEYAPYAPQDIYYISFPETALEGEVIGSAGPGTNMYYIIDDDSGEDGLLTYIALNDPPSPYFTVSETGDIILLTEIDYEEEQNFTSSILIHGCDRATLPVHCPNITVYFLLVSVNDNDPFFLQSQYWVQIDEGLHRATQLMVNITCMDNDIGDGRYGGIEILSSTLDFIELANVEIGTVTLLLTAAVDYDFTNITEFDVRLSCYDISTSDMIRFDDTTVHIEVLPINDHMPMFMSQWFNTSVLESLPVGSFILTVQCSDQDRDYGKFSAISLYQPTPETNEMFHINPHSGTITLTSTLDYDNPATRNHIFTISCMDGGGKQAIAMVAIATLPVSDEPLTFQYSVFKFAVKRLSTVGSKVGQVIAIDGDQGEAPVIIYSLEENDVFEIDEDGYIILTDILSQDKDDFFNLTVQARDSEGVIEALVEITVKGSLSILEVINIVIGLVGIIVVVIIGILVSVCSYCCWKLYGSSSTSATTEVPVRYMSGNKIPHHRPSSAHSRSSTGVKRHSGALRERSTLSMQRTKKKKPAHSFKRRARQRPSMKDSLFTNTRTAVADDNQVLFGSNPQDFDMTLFTNQSVVNDDLKEEDEEIEESTHNIFNPEDAGLMLGDIMLFPGEEHTRWNEDDNEGGEWSFMRDDEDGIKDEKSSYEEDEEYYDDGNESGSDFGGSGEWNVTHEDDDSINILTHI